MHLISSYWSPAAECPPGGWVVASSLSKALRDRKGRVGSGGIVGVEAVRGRRERVERVFSGFVLMF